MLNSRVPSREGTRRPRYATPFHTHLYPSTHIYTHTHLFISIHIPIQPIEPIPSNPPRQHNYLPI